MWCLIHFCIEHCLSQAPIISLGWKHNPFFQLLEVSVPAGYIIALYGGLKLVPPSGVGVALLEKVCHRGGGFQTLIAIICWETVRVAQLLLYSQFSYHL